MRLRSTYVGIGQGKVLERVADLDEHTVVQERELSVHEATLKLRELAEALSATFFIDKVDLKH